MQVELSIIKYLLSYEHFSQYSSYLKPTDFPDELRIIWTSLCSIHSTNDGDANPCVLDLANAVFACHPKDKEFYEKCFEHLEQYVPLEKPVVALIESLKQRRILQDLSIASYEVAEGKKDIDVVNKLVEKLQDTTTIEIEDEFVSDDLEILLNDTVKSPGLRWRLRCLNESLGSLRQGDFGFIFARPEAGKTTFLASEVSNFLTQKEGNFLWFN